MPGRRFLTLTIAGLLSAMLGAAQLPMAGAEGYDQNEPEYLAHNIASLDESSDRSKLTLVIGLSERVAQTFLRTTSNSRKTARNTTQYVVGMRVKAYPSGF